MKHKLHCHKELSGGQGRGIRQGTAAPAPPLLATLMLNIN